MDIAYIYSHDGDEHGIKFGVELCTRSTLRETVKKHLYPDGIPDGDAEIFAGVMEEIDEKGSCDFEDGWIVVKDGAAAIIEFLIDQLRECKAEERFEGERAYKEMQRREAAEAKYKTLQQALLVALGPNAPDVADAVAA
jgi:hypothetical protein